MAIVVASSLAVTANDMIERAMRLVKALGTGQTMTSEEGVTGLHALNSMLDSWNLEKLMVFYFNQISGSLPAATTSRTIGDSGNYDTVRPVKIDTAFLRSGSNDYPLEVRPIEEYDAIANKTSQGVPEFLYYAPDFPLGILYFYPVPSAAYTLYLRHEEQLEYFSSLTEEVYLPPGYRRAIEYNLALEVAPEFGVEVPAEVFRNASLSKGAIKQANYRPRPVGVEVGLMNYSHSDVTNG